MSYFVIGPIVCCCVERADLRGLGHAQECTLSVHSCP